MTCDPKRDSKVAYLGVSEVLGFFFGSVFLTPLTDVIGRKKTNIILTLVMVLPVIVITIMQTINKANYIAFVVLIFISGLAGAPRFNMGCLYPCEFTTDEKMLLYNFNV